MDESDGSENTTSAESESESASEEQEAKAKKESAVDKDESSDAATLEAKPAADEEISILPPATTSTSTSTSPSDQTADTSDTDSQTTTSEADIKTKPEQETASESSAEPPSEEKPETDAKEEGSTYLELDLATQQRMQELEEAERLALEEEEEEQEVGIFAVKTSIGHEKMVANWLAQRVRKRKGQIYAILSPPKLRGYLLLEGVKNKEALQDLIKGVQHARSVVDGATSLDEIEHFLTPKPLVSGIEEGDVVEIIAGPFKGEKAKVTQIDESKEEITVELFEAMVSIPVTIRGDHVRILEKEAK